MDYVKAECVDFLCDGSSAHERSDQFRFRTPVSRSGNKKVANKIEFGTTLRPKPVIIESVPSITYQVCG
jgi:hypothetical protein